MATRRRRRRATRRNPGTRRYKSGPKKGQFMPKGAKARKSRKTRAKRTTKRTTRRAAGRSRTKRAAAPRRTRRTRRPAGKLIRPRLYRGKKGRIRRGPRSSIRSGTVINPFAIPSMRQVTGLFQDGAYGVAGYVGVNAVVWALDTYVIGGIKGKQGPQVAALIDIAERVFGTAVATWLGGKVFKGPNARRLIAVGGAVNVVMSTIKVANAQFNFLPEQAQSLLSGYEYLDGDYLGDYIGVGDYMQSLPAGSGSTATGQFSALASMGQDGAPLI